MKRLYFLSIASVFCVTCAFSQAPNKNCTQILRLMRSTYEQGRLHELEPMSDACLVSGFTKEERKEAYRLLALTHIYLEEPEKADAAMLKLLDTDHFFEINPSLDPAEFIALYKKFRHDPLYSIDLKFGVNASQPGVSQYYNVGSTGGGKGTYGMGISIQILAAFEKDITKKIVAAPEIGYVSRSFTYTNTDLAYADEDPTKAISSQEFQFSQSWIDLNGIALYKLKDTQEIKTYVGGGPGMSYLLGSKNQASTKLGNDFTVTGGSIDDTGSYNKIVYSFTVMAGLKIKFADFYVMFDARYQFGLKNAINPETRTNPAVGFDYQGQYSDYKMNNLVLSAGVSYPVFKPKKLIK